MQSVVNWDEVGANLMREGWTYKQAEDGVECARAVVADGWELDEALSLARQKREQALSPPENPESPDAILNVVEAENPRDFSLLDPRVLYPTNAPLLSTRPEPEPAPSPYLDGLEGMLRFNPERAREFRQAWKGALSAEQVERAFTAPYVNPDGTCVCGVPGCPFPKGAGQLAAPLNRAKVMALDTWHVSLAMDRGPDIAHALVVNYCFTGDQANRAVGRAEDIINQQPHQVSARALLLDQLIAERHAGFLDRDHDFIAMMATRCGYEADPDTWPMNATNQILNAMRLLPEDSRAVRTTQVIAYIGGERRLEHYRCPEPLWFLARQIVTLDLCVDYPRRLRDELVFHHGFKGYQAWQALRDLREILARDKGQSAEGDDCLLLVTARRDSGLYEKDPNNPGTAWYGFRNMWRPAARAPFAPPPLHLERRLGRQKEVTRPRAVAVRAHPPDTISPPYHGAVDVGEGSLLEVRGRGDTVERGAWRCWPAQIEGETVLLLQRFDRGDVPDPYAEVITLENAVDLATVLLNGARTGKEKS